MASCLTPHDKLYTVRYKANDDAVVKTGRVFFAYSTSPKRIEYTLQTIRGT